MWLEALFVIGAALIAVGVFIYVIKWIIQSQEAKREQERIEHQQAIEATRVWRENRRAQSLSAAIANTSSVPPRGQETTKRYDPQTTKFAPSPTQSVQSHDDGSNLIANMIIMDALTRHHNEPTYRSVDTSPSWGFDDSDSRKSISSSMDTSSSYSSSSSSDSYSSSSDSSPSSDW